LFFQNWELSVYKNFVSFFLKKATQKWGDKFPVFFFLGGGV